MLYENHRIVGVIELDQTTSHNEQAPMRRGASQAARAAAVAIRRIGFELAEAASVSPLPFESTIKVDAQALSRELQAELASFLVNRTTHSIA